MSDAITLPCLSIWQPWAQLIGHGYRLAEARTWALPRKYIGKTLAIAAAKKLDRDAWIHLCSQYNSNQGRRDAMSRCMGQFGTPDTWPQGCVIGLVHAVGCASPNATDSLPPKFRRWAMRDRYTWLFAEAAPLKEPLPVRGKQGIFQVEIPTNLIPEGVQIHV